MISLLLFSKATKKAIPKIELEKDRKVTLQNRLEMSLFSKMLDEISVHSSTNNSKEETTLPFRHPSKLLLLQNTLPLKEKTVENNCFPLIKGLKSNGEIYPLQSNTLFLGKEEEKERNLPFNIDTDFTPLQKAKRKNSSIITSTLITLTKARQKKVKVLNKSDVIQILTNLKRSPKLSFSHKRKETQLKIKQKNLNLNLTIQKNGKKDRINIVFTIKAEETLSSLFLTESIQNFKFTEQGKEVATEKKPHNFNLQKKRVIKTYLQKGIFENLKSLKGKLNHKTSYKVKEGKLNTTKDNYPILFAKLKTHLPEEEEKLKFNPFFNISNKTKPKEVKDSQIHTNITPLKFSSSATKKGKTKHYHSLKPSHATFKLKEPAEPLEKFSNFPSEIIEIKNKNVTSSSNSLNRREKSEINKEYSNFQMVNLLNTENPKENSFNENSNHGQNPQSSHSKGTIPFNLKPSHHFELNLNQFSVKAIYRPGFINLNLNFSDSSFVSPILVEEIRDILKSFGMGGVLNLKIKGKQLYSEKIKREKEGIEIKV